MSFDMRAKPFDLDDNAVRWVNDTFNAMTQEEKSPSCLWICCGTTPGSRPPHCLEDIHPEACATITASPGNCTDKTRRHKKQPNPAAHRSQCGGGR